MKKKNGLIGLFLIICILLTTSFTSVAANTIREGSFEYRILNEEATLVKYYESGSTSVTIPSITQQGYSVKTIGKDAFKESSIEHIIISEGIEIIGEGAFYICGELKSVTLPPTITTIEAVAFFNCFLLNNVTLPKILKELDSTAFNGCTGLDKLTVHAENPHFSAQDGVLFNKDKTSLILCPNVKARTSYAVPSTVKKIEERAFYGCSYLKSVSFPAGLQEIADDAFKGCGLTTVAMGEGINKVGLNAFPYDKIQSVRFYSVASKNKYKNLFTGAKEIVCLCRNEHIYDNASDETCNVCEYKRNVTQPTPQVPSKITSSTYKISGGYISKIAFGKTIQQLVNGINEKQYIRVYSGNKQVTGSTKVGTGMSVKLLDGNTVKDTLTAVVTGDTNGDGNVTITDMLAIKSHLLKKSTLSGAPAKAADTSGDNVISITDFIQVKAYILKKGTIQAR